MKTNSAYQRKKTSFRNISPFFKNMSWIQIGLIGGLILFEIFNFDTSRFALDSILGSQKFARISWSSILAIAFCGIDSLSLVNMFGPEENVDAKDWLLLGAWLIGAALNACLTWWSVSIIMLENTVGNEVLSKEELIFYAPIVVAALVLLTRIALIGSLVFASNGAFEVPNPKMRQRTRSQKSRGDNRRQHVPTRAPVRASSTSASFSQSVDSNARGRRH